MPSATTKMVLGGFPGGSDGKESACNAGDPSSIPGSRRFPWRREWQPTPVFLHGEFHGQRILAGYSQWDRKEPDTTEPNMLSKINETKTNTHDFTDMQNVKNKMKIDS